MPTTQTPFPPIPASISGPNLTLSVFLQSPALVQKTLESLTSQRFIANRIFTGGPTATGGAVLYDQLTAQNLYPLRDVQEITPGSEFPIVNGQEPNPLLAQVRKWGGSAIFTYEQVRRNRLDVMKREMTRIGNAILRKVDTVAIATVDAAPINTQAASGSWATAATDIIADVETGKNTLDALDMGYEAAWVLINPREALSIRKDQDIRTAFPRETLGDNLLNKGAADLNGILGLEWYVTNRVAAGSVYVGANDVGFISDEIPGPYSRVINEEANERYRVMGARVPTMGVTDPKAVVKITGA